MKSCWNKLVSTVFCHRPFAVCQASELLQLFRQVPWANVQNACRTLVERLYIVSCGLWMAVKHKAAISKHHKTKWWALQHYLFFSRSGRWPEPFFFSVKRFGQLDPSVKVAGSCARNWRSEGEDLVWITGLKSVSKKISWLSRNQSKLETLCVWRDLQGTWCAPELLLEFSDFPTSSSELIRPWSRSS